MGCGGSKQTTASPNGPPKRGQNSVSRKDKSYSSVHSSPARSKNSKYIGVNGSAGNDTTSSKTSFSFQSEATDKGFKRRIREKLRAATAENDIAKLEAAMERFQNHHLEDCGDLTRAQERLQYLKLRRDLRDSIRRSHVGVLEKTIAEAKKSKFSAQLSNQIEAAERKLAHLQELNKYNHDVLTMEQTTISEIHSYQRPPPCVHDVMAATYMLLGYPEHKLTEWADIQFLLCRVGRDSLLHEIRDFDSASVDEQTSKRVQDMLSQHQLSTIRQASNGAAAFYVWSTQICEKIERDKQKEENRLRKEDMDKQRQLEKEQQKSGGRKPKG